VHAEVAEASRQEETPIMNEDPYKVLGLKPDASQEDIHRAFKRLARKLHPDLNPGNKEAEEKFKKVSAAHDLLGDPEKRARFDRGEIDATGAERPQPRYYRDFAEADGHNPYTSDAGFADLSDTDELLASLFGRRGRGVRMAGADIRGQLALDFLEAVNGTTKRLKLPDGSTVDVTVPPGVHDGQVLRLRGKGRPGIGGGAHGDLLVELQVGEHPRFTRQGDDIHFDLPISLPEAVLGGRVEAPTPGGPIMVTVPKGSNTGTILRLRGRGVRRPDGSHGDAYATLRIVLPQHPDAELEAFAERWAAGKAHNPRSGTEV